MKTSPTNFNVNQHIDFHEDVRGGKRLSPAVTLLAAMDRPASGLGDGMIPSPGAGETVSYGIARINAAAHADLNCPFVPGRSQRVSCQVNGTFYVYHEDTHGDDSYLVVYLEDGLISIASPQNPLIVTVGDKWDDNRAGTGYALFRMRNHVGPTVNNEFVSWVASSPTTVNQEQTRTDQTVESFDTSVTLNAKDGGSITSSHSFQIWHGTEMKVTDWNIDETSDAASKVCQWLWYQNMPWSGKDRDASNFASWWEDAYNVGGGWDDTKGFTELSTTTLQYHSCAAWRFGPELRTKDADGSSHLRVGFQGSTESDFCLIAMPQLGHSGHHTFFPASIGAPWNYQLDLVELSQLE